MGWCPVNIKLITSKSAGGGGGFELNPKQNGNVLENC
jgi:hypothetical protein